MSKKSKDKDPEMVELEEMNIILRIPKKAIALDITATIMVDGQPHECKEVLRCRSRSYSTSF